MYVVTILLTIVHFITVNKTAVFFKQILILPEKNIYIVSEIRDDSYVLFI